MLNIQTYLRAVLWIEFGVDWDDPQGKGWVGLTVSRRLRVDGEVMLVIVV